MKFLDLPLEGTLLEDIQKLGYEACTPIQESCIPAVLEGKDIAGLAQTGTGKTAAFLVPLIQRVIASKKKDPEAKHQFADWLPTQFILVLVPTRELAEQVLDSVEKLGVTSGIRGVSVYGGTGYDKQKEGIRNRVEFVVATPGRLIDLYKDHSIDLKQVRAIVFDEADRMFDMGFKDDMKYILQRVPQNRQFLVFSATLNFEVLNTAYQFGANPVEVNISREKTKADNVTDEIFHAGQEDKPQYLLSLLKKYNPKQAIIFSNFKHNVDRLSRFLVANQLAGLGISSLLTQAQRNRVLQSFRDTETQSILVATDVAARGLDIQGVDLVINYDLPSDPENYVHRIGRTGRAGATGRAFSLVSDRDVESLQRIEEYLKNKLAVGWLEDTEILQDFHPLQHYSEESESSSRGFTSNKFEGRRNTNGRRDGPNRGPRKNDRDGSSGGDSRRDRNDRDRGASRNSEFRQGDHRQVGKVGDKKPHLQSSHNKGSVGGAPSASKRTPETKVVFNKKSKRDDNFVNTKNKTHFKSTTGSQGKPRSSVVVRRPHGGFWNRVTGFLKRMWSAKTK